MRTKKTKRLAARPTVKARALKAPVVLFLPRLPNEEPPLFARTVAAPGRPAARASSRSAVPTPPASAYRALAKSRPSAGAPAARTLQVEAHRPKRPTKKTGRQKTAPVRFGQVGPPRGGTTRPEDDSQPGDSTASRRLEPPRHLPDGTARQAPGFNDRPRNWHAFQRAAADLGKPMSRRRRNVATTPPPSSPSTCRSVRRVRPPSRRTHSAKHEEFADPRLTRSADPKGLQRTTSVQVHLNNAIRPLDAEPLEPVSLGASVARHLALVRLAVRGVGDAVRELEAKVLRHEAAARVVAPAREGSR